MNVARLEPGSATRRIKILSGAPQMLAEMFNIISIAGALILLCILFSALTPAFLTVDNGYHIMQQVAVLLVVAVGQSVVIYTAGIDLGQAAVVALAGVLGATAAVRTDNVWVGILVTIFVGALAGVLNGLLIVGLRLVPFIATLAMLGIASGSALIVTGGQPVFDLPKAFTAFGSGSVGMIPYTAAIAFLVIIVGHFYLSATRSGRHIYAIGSNYSGSRSVGIRVKRVVVAAYIISGMTAGIAAILQYSYLQTAQPTMDMNLELNAIAAVIIGGGSLFGGEGNLLGTVAGVLLIGVLTNGTQLIGLSSYVQTILLGLVVILAVSIDNFRRSERLAA